MPRVACLCWTWILPGTSALPVRIHVSLVYHLLKQAILALPLVPVSAYTTRNTYMQTCPQYSSVYKYCTQTVLYTHMLILQANIETLRLVKDKTGRRKNCHSLKSHNYRFLTIH